jgi:hypothetical protein
MYEAEVIDGCSDIFITCSVHAAAVRIDPGVIALITPLGHWNQLF